MINTISKKNGIQDQRITRLECNVKENTEAIDKSTKAIESLSGKISNFLGNHIATIQTDVKWLKRGFWMLLSGIAIPIWIFIVFKFFN